MMERCIDVAVKKIFKVSVTENCKAIRFCVGLDHIDDIIKKRNCKFMNSLVAHHFELDVLQLAFNELFTFSFFDFSCIVLSVLKSANSEVSYSLLVKF